MTPSDIQLALTFRPLWEHLEETRSGAWCQEIKQSILNGVNNATLFQALELGNHPLLGPRRAERERTAYFAAFDYVRAANWMVVKQFVQTGNPQQPQYQLR